MGTQVRVYGQACIEPRYREAFEQFIQKKFNLKPTEYGLKTDAGGAKEIALRTQSGEWMLANAEIAYHKHGARIFVLCNHIDCAHYGGSGQFSGFEEEKQAYSRDLKVAAAIYRERFEDVRVLAYIVSKEQRSSREAFVFQEVAV